MSLMRPPPFAFCLSVRRRPRSSVARCRTAAERDMLSQRGAREGGGGRLRAAPPDGRRRLAAARSEGRRLGALADPAPPLREDLGEHRALGHRLAQRHKRLVRLVGRPEPPLLARVEGRVAEAEVGVDLGAEPVDDDGETKLKRSEVETKTLDTNNLKPGVKLTKQKVAKWKEADHYGILGLQDLRFDATTRQIRAAHRALSLRVRINDEMEIFKFFFQVPSG